MEKVIKSKLAREVITDIWFVTEIDLQELADKLGISDIHFDSGESWEWVSGRLLDFKLDMTRTQPKGNKDTQTRVFLFDEDLHFSEGFTEYLAAKLKTFGISSIYFGRWVPIKGDQYEQIVVRKET